MYIYMYRQVCSTCSILQHRLAQCSAALHDIAPYDRERLNFKPYSIATCIRRGQRPRAS